MNVNLSQDVSQGDSNASCSEGNLSGDDSVKSSNSNHPDNKEENLAYASRPSNNDSVFDKSMSKSKASSCHRGVRGMKYDELLQVNLDRYNMQAVRNIVVSDLFPRIKFFDKDRDLKYSSEEGTICHYVLNRCQLNYDSDQEEILWDKAKDWIIQYITRLRSDKMTAMKKEFYSKLYISDFVCF